MDRAVQQWIDQTGLLADHKTSITKRLNKSYTIYGCMLLLPPSAFQAEEWNLVQEETVDTLYKYIAKELKITHIAINSPIPLHHSNEEKAFNVLRSPSNFTPVYGNFGPETSSQPPTQSEFDQALWVTAKQNGIYQTWAPRWTMFSRGNISEKARLLTLPSVVQAVEEGECTAVDLYAGIGYFAFSYVKAGVRKVMCWDLNPWSCEGLRRGARVNKWEVETFSRDGCAAVGDSDARLVVFSESNERAPDRIEKLREHLPPIRHVNCGMLPSSRDSLELAARALDRRYLSWVHIHENFLVEQIEDESEKTRQEFQTILERIRGVEVRTEIEFINRLKSYAPGVMHCVLDVAVYPT